MNKIVKAVRAWQELHKMNDIALSEILDIDHSAWSLLRRGKRQPGLKFLKSVAKNMPALQAYILEYISLNSYTEEPDPDMDAEIMIKG